MFEMKFNEAAAEELFLLELKKRLEQVERRLTFWDMDELCKQTCMSVNNIKDKFFYNPDFPKYRIGGKWYMPAEKTEKWLIDWIHQQAKN